MVRAKRGPMRRTRNPEVVRGAGFRVRSPSDKIDFVNFARGSRPGMTIYIATTTLQRAALNGTIFP
jgi:hypothetical protein